MFYDPDQKNETRRSCNRVSLAEEMFISQAEKGRDLWYILG